MHPKAIDRTCTTHERRSLASGLNLSDAHCRQPLVESQLKIIDNLPRLFHQATTKTQFELEEQFIDSYLRLAGQTRQYPYESYMLSYSASCAITMVASYCKRYNKVVALLEPFFDNIPSILRREGVALRSLPEDLITESCDYSDIHSIGTADIIWIASPNNPTGFRLGRKQFIELVEFCQRHQKTLVLDYCFRFFCEDMRSWDQYEILKASGVSFVALEDTGKTWSTAEMKLGISVCSDDLFSEMYRLHDDLLQSVSPFHLALLNAFVRDVMEVGVEDTILHFVTINRDIVRSALSNGALQCGMTNDSKVPVEWIKIGSHFTGDELQSDLSKLGVHILPGRNFYWDTPSRGDRFIRMALSRDPNTVRSAIPIIVDAIARLAANQTHGSDPSQSIAIDSHETKGRVGQTSH